MAICMSQTRNWESYRVFTAPINWRLESGDRIEINYMPRGERLVEPFNISDGVSIPAGEYHFNRYRLETELAAKRKLNGQLTWWFGTFYGGDLNEFEASLNINPSNTLNFEFLGIHNIGRLPYGDFDQTLMGYGYVLMRHQTSSSTVSYNTIQIPRVLGSIHVSIGFFILRARYSLSTITIHLIAWSAGKCRPNSFY